MSQEEAQQQYVINDKGEKVIPGTRRPDGSFRKEIKVREGYIPPEEQGAYVSKGAQIMQQRANMKPAGYDGDDGADPTAGMSKSQKKNAKRRAKKKPEGGAGQSSIPGQ